MFIVIFDTFTFFTFRVQMEKTLNSVTESVTESVTGTFESVTENCFHLVLSSYKSVTKNAQMAIRFNCGGF